MNFNIVFKKHTVQLKTRMPEKTEILGNFTCKIAGGEWENFISLGIVKKPDIEAGELANSFLQKFCNKKIPGIKLLAYSEIAEQYNDNSESYSICRKVLSENKVKPEIVDIYTVEQIKDLIFLEMLYVAEQNMHISQCRNCGKYYSSAYAGTDYCDRIFKDDKTCKLIGAKKTYSMNLKADDALVLYEKMYQALQYKKRRAQTNAEIADIQKKISSIRTEREKYKKGEFSSDEFIEIINSYK